jgi:hypothetical protein
MIALVVAFNLIYTIGIPLLLFRFTLRAHRDGTIGKASYDYRFGSLTLAYTSDCWYWESV